MKKFYLCYFDILGIRDVIKNISPDACSLPKATRIKCNLITKVSKTIVDSIKGVVAEWRGKHAKWNGIAGVSQFSDSFFVYVEDCPEGRQLFNGLLVEIGCIYWEMLCKALPIRGVVAYGDGALIEGGCLCGPVCDIVEKYEKEYAQYSRIVFVGVGEWCKGMCCTTLDGGVMLDILSEEVCKRCGTSTVKLGNATLMEEVRKLKMRPDVLKKHVKTWQMQKNGGVLKVISKDGSMVIDADRIALDDPYPRLRPDDYFVAYLKVEKVLDVKEKSFIGFSSKVEDDTFVSLVQMLVSHFVECLKTIKESPREVFERALIQNYELSDAEFVQDASKLCWGVQQINNDIMVWVKNEHVSAPFSFTYALGELSTKVYQFIGKGCFIRGAVAHGAGWELENGVLFGPVVKRAFDELCADSFALRIVLSEDAVDELSTNALVSRYAEGQHPLFTKDMFDGRWFLNFASRCLRTRRLEMSKGMRSWHFVGEDWLNWSFVVGLLHSFVEKFKSDDGAAVEKFAKQLSRLCDFVEANMFSI